MSVIKEVADLWKRIKKYVSLALCVSGAVIGTFSLTNCSTRKTIPDKARPVNIVFIYADQYRTDGVAAYGRNVPVHTPYLDSLAERGTLFENHFIQCPVCMPSRVSLLTSLYPHQTGVLFNGQGPWPSGVTTFPEVFAEAGYVTASFGKAHTPAHNTWQIHHPLNVLDDIAGYSDLGSAYDDAEHEIIRHPGNRSILSGIYPETDDGTNHVKYVVDNALNWLNQTRNIDKPFLLRISLEAPHQPVLVPRELYNMYSLEDMDWDVPTQELLNSLPLFERQRPHSINHYFRFTEDQIRRMRASYYALATYVDQQVGRILEELEKLDLMHNTIVVFTSDHGMLIGEYGHFGKNIFYDLTTRVPLIIAGPGVPEGKRVSDLTEQVDLGPTLLHLAGVDIHPQFQGQALFSEDYTSREYVIGEIAPLGIRRSWIRTEHWSLDYTSEISGKKTESTEERDGKLIDLLSDPLGHRNLYYDPEYADIVEELTKLLEERTAEGRREMYIPKI